MINRQEWAPGMPKGNCDFEVLYTGRIFEEEPAPGAGSESSECSNVSIECFQDEGFMEEP